MSLKLCFFLVFFCFYYQGECIGVGEIFKKDLYSLYRHAVEGTRKIIGGDVTEDQVNYYLFTRDNPNYYKQIETARPDALNNRNVTIVFIIHGWVENRFRPYYELLKNAFFARQDKEYYVVAVDWSEAAEQHYPIAAYNTKDVGYHIANFIVYLHRRYSIPLKNFLPVGHSLGGHVVGFLGKKIIAELNQKLPRIISLDPAGPLFLTRPVHERLHPNDAKVVEVLHTDGGGFGLMSSCGTIDIYANGGFKQPGCTHVEFKGFETVPNFFGCDHFRSWQYYTEALLNPMAMVATRCSSWTKYELHQCDYEEKVALGDLETTMRGDFHFRTNSRSPFGRDAPRMYPAAQPFYFGN